MLDDGQYPAYLTGIDVSARSVTFDVIQFLTGEAADEAYHQDYPETEGHVPNGYYIRNVNPRLRTLPVRQDATVRVVWLNGDAATEPISFDGLPGYFAAAPSSVLYRKRGAWVMSIAIGSWTRMRVSSFR